MVLIKSSGSMLTNKVQTQLLFGRFSFLSQKVSQMSIFWHVFEFNKGFLPQFFKFSCESSFWKYFDRQSKEKIYGKCLKLVRLLHLQFTVTKNVGKLGVVRENQLSKYNNLLRILAITFLGKNKRIHVFGKTWFSQRANFSTFPVTAITQTNFKLLP